MLVFVRVASEVPQPHHVVRDEEQRAADELRGRRLDERETLEQRLVAPQRGERHGDAAERHPVHDQQQDVHAHGDLDAPLQDALRQARVLFDHLREVVQPRGEADGDEHEEQVRAAVRYYRGEERHR
eukprot:6928-Pelagococcus_subviridis.AAC.5